MKIRSDILYILFAVLVIQSASFAGNSQKSTQEMKELVAQELQLLTAIENEPLNSIEDYVTYSLSHNPQLKSLYYTFASSVEKITIESSLADPQLSVGYFIENVETKVGPQNKKFGLRQKVPWFGTLGTKEHVAIEKSQIVYQKYQSFKQKLIYDIKKSYYQHWLLQKRIQITQDNFHLLVLWESIVRTKYKTAQVALPDLVKIQIELAKLDEKLIELKNSLVPSEAHLRSILNIENDIAILVVDTLEIHKSEINELEIRSRIEQNNPDLLVTIHALQRDSLLQQVVSKSNKPQFSFGVDYIDIGESTNSSTFESGKDAWAVSASISIPLWLSKNRAKKKSSVLAIQSSQQQMQQKQNELHDMLSQIIFAYDDSHRKIKLYRDGLIPKAEQVINVSLKAYQADNLNMRTLLDSQQDLLEFQYMLDKSKVRFALQEAALNRIMSIDKY